MNTLKYILLFVLCISGCLCNAQVAEFKGDGHWIVAGSDYTNEVFMAEDTSGTYLYVTNCQLNIDSIKTTADVRFRYYNVGMARYYLIYDISLHSGKGAVRDSVIKYAVFPIYFYIKDITDDIKEIKQLNGRGFISKEEKERLWYKFRIPKECLLYVSPKIQYSPYRTGTSTAYPISEKVATSGYMKIY